MLGRLGDLMAMLNNLLRTERVGMPAMLGLRVSLCRGICDRLCSTVSGELNPAR